MNEFDEYKFGSYLGKGKLNEAINYLSKFPEKRDWYEGYIEVFKKGQYYKRTDNKVLGSIDKIYQNYYRSIFWENHPKEDAEKNLFQELWQFCGSKSDFPKDENIENEIKKIVNLLGYEYLGGRTQGFYGPYIWKNSKKETYEVELPSGKESYTIVMMDGFISRSWLDFISFGNTGPGGWADENGTLHCVRNAYDTESDEFYNSFLKHEAQHSYDMRVYPNISAVDLEYRAKLVELIYWSNDEKIKQIYRQADNSNPGNSHSVAAYQIISKMSQKIFGCEYIDNEKMLEDKLDSIKSYAMLLLDKSSKLLNSRNMIRMELVKNR